MVRTRSTSSVVECPICMDPSKFAAETNCGHLYCGNCILQVWQTNSIMNPILCPYCRQEVTVILPCFTEGEENSAELSEIEERENIKVKIAEYNRIFSKLPRSFFGHIRDLPTILRHVWAEMFTWRGLEFFYRGRIFLCFILAAIYAVMPSDLLPEALLGIIGLLDDAIIVIFLLIQAGIFYRAHVGGEV